MVFKIKRKFLVGLANWLNSLSLQGPQSRARTRFVALAQEALERAEKERKDLLDEYAEKEEDGSLKKEKNDKGEENFVVPDDKLPEFSAEVNKLFEEDAEITAPEISTALVIMRNVVLNTEEKIGPSIAVQYEEWCKAFESLEIK